MECPNRDCEKNFDRRITGLEKTNYGETGTGGVVGCLKDKVSKKTLWSSTISILAILAIFVIAGMSSWGQADEERKENKENIAVIKNQIEGINKNIDDIKTGLTQIHDKQIDPNKLLNEIKETINNQFN